MIKKIKVEQTDYLFDTSNLTLFKDKVVNVPTLSSDKVAPDQTTIYKLVFNVSNTCNLQCKYCYASCGNYGRQNNFMTIDTASKIVNDLKKNIKKIKTVYFFGGEPTLNPKTIVYLVNELNKSYMINDYRIVTNASAVTDELVQLFIKNNFKVYISIDGPKQINDFLRGNYYEKLESTIKKLKNSDIKNKLELICTYTKFHQDNIPMDELIDFYERLGVKYSISDVITNDKLLKIHKTKTDILNQEKRFIDVSLDRLFNNSLNVGISSYIRNVIDAFVLKKPVKCFCNELKDGYSRVYDYNGDIYPCIRLIGTHKSDDELVMKCNSKDNDKCSKCWAKNFCTDCVADVILGNVKAPYTSSKCYKKILYNYALRKCIELNHCNPDKFKTILNNYYTNYLF